MKKKNMEVAGINANSRKLVDLVQYATNPCKNCKGPTFFLDGQIVRNTYTRDWNQDQRTEEYWIKDYYGVQVKVLSGNTGEKGDGYPTRVIWKHAGCQYCNDLTGFVYN